MTYEENHEDSVKELSRATLGAMLGVAFSRFSGILRQIAINALFGVTQSMSAFYVAQRFPNLLRDLLADGALASAFSNVLARAKSEGLEKEREVIAAVLGFFVLFSLLLAILGAVFAEPFMRLVTHASWQERTAQFQFSVTCFRILAFFLPLMTLSAVAMAVLGVHRQTFRAMFASGVGNGGLVVGAILFLPLMHVFQRDVVLALAWGTLFGGIIQFVYQGVALWKQNLLPLPRLRLLDLRASSPVMEVTRLILPRVFGQGMALIGLFVNTLLATENPTTAVYLMNAQIVVLAPVGLFGVASGFASLPVLCTAVQAKDEERFWRLTNESLSGVLWLSVMSAIGLSLLGVPLCRILFGYGRFTLEDSLILAGTISAYSVSIVFNSVNKILQQAFFALSDTRYTAFIAFLSTIVTIVVTYLFSRIDSGPLPFGFAVSVSSLVSYLFHLFFLRCVVKKQKISWKFLDISNRWLLLGVFPSAAILCSILGAWIALNIEQWVRMVGMSFENWFLAASVLCILGGGIFLFFYVLLCSFGPMLFVERLKVFENKLRKLLR